MTLVICLKMESSHDVGEVNLSDFSDYQSSTFAKDQSRGLELSRPVPF